jgi:hypothetical protein
MQEGNELKFRQLVIWALLGYSDPVIFQLSKA